MYNTNPITHPFVLLNGPFIHMVTILSLQLLLLFQAQLIRTTLTRTQTARPTRLMPSGRLSHHATDKHRVTGRHRAAPTRS